MADIKRIVIILLCLFASAGSKVAAQGKGTSTNSAPDVWKEACGALIAQGDFESLKAAQELLKPRAEKQDGVAQLVLALTLGVEEDEDKRDEGKGEEGRRWLEKAVAAGNADAMWYVGASKYIRVDRLNPDEVNAEAEAMLAKAIKKGHELAQLMLIYRRCRACEPGIIDKAQGYRLSKEDARLLSRYVKKGNMVAQYCQGVVEMMLASIDQREDVGALEDEGMVSHRKAGKEVKKIKKRMEKGAAWLEMSAERGFAQAGRWLMDALVCYSLEQPSDARLLPEKKAVQTMKLLRETLIEHKRPFVQEIDVFSSSGQERGYIYDTEKRLPAVGGAQWRKPEETLWFSPLDRELKSIPVSKERVEQAAEKGDAKALYYMGDHLVWWHGDGKGKEMKTAVENARRSAEAGYAPGQRLLAWLYRKGFVDGKPNEEEYAVWLKKAADQQDLRAIVDEVDLCIKNKQWQEAEKWGEKLIAQNERMGYECMGRCYAEQGQRAKAIECWQQAIKLGSMDAMRALGVLYAGTQGGSPNRKLAVKWLKQYMDVYGLFLPGYTKGEMPCSGSWEMPSNDSYVQALCLLMLLR